MKILVTGHAGFIGQNLVEYLETQTDHEVLKYEWNPEVFPSVKELDWVIHLGAISSTNSTDLEKVMRQNYDFTVDLYHACVKNKVNLQYASSASVYGDGRVFQEDAPMQPKTLYAMSKAMIERYINRVHNGQIVCQGFRYFNVFGKYEDHKVGQSSPHHAFRQQAKDTGVITLYHGLDHNTELRRDFVPVETVIDVHMKFLNVKESGVWNVGSGVATSFEEVAWAIADETGAKVASKLLPEHMRTGYQSYTCADLTKLNETLRRSMDRPTLS